MSRYTVTFDDEYSVLHGPDGFECVLGEPEDRTWTRDGADVVARLETLESEIDRLRAENEALKKHQSASIEAIGNSIGDATRLREDNDRLRGIVPDLVMSCTTERKDCHGTGRS